MNSTLTTRAARGPDDQLALLREVLPVQRRLVHAGDCVIRAGERFDRLHIVHSGIFKSVTTSADGRERVCALHFRGDWFGFDGIAGGTHTCDVVAMDIGELWSTGYTEVLAAGARHPEVVGLLHKAMSAEIKRERDAMLALCTLRADARVADFLQQWTEALSQRGLRTDEIQLRLTRAEIGNHLGLTLETVSRALSRMARADVIRFAGRGRRNVQIPEPRAFASFIDENLMQAQSVHVPQRRSVAQVFSPSSL